MSISRARRIRGDSGFVQRLIPQTPAVMLAFLGAQPHADSASSTSLNLTATWGAYCIVGWQGQTEEQRRLAVDAGYDIVARVAPILHNAIIEDPVQQRLPIPSVTGIETLTDSSLDVVNLWVCKVQVRSRIAVGYSRGLRGAARRLLENGRDVRHSGR